jgi:hypothetical protein
MHGFWTIPTASMMYINLQLYTSMMRGEHGIQTFEVMIVLSLLLWLSFDGFIPANAHP